MMHHDFGVYFIFLVARLSHFENFQERGGAPSGRFLPGGSEQQLGIGPMCPPLIKAIAI